MKILQELPNSCKINGQCILQYNKSKLRPIIRFLLELYSNQEKKIRAQINSNLKKSLVNYQKKIQLSFINNN